MTTLESSGTWTSSAAAALELNAGAATITHSGSTSLVLESTNGVVQVEDVLFDGGA